MAKVLRFVGSGCLFTVGAATLAVAAYTLRNARKYVELVEDRMENLREEQAGVLGFLREERRAMTEDSRREREQRLEVQRKVELLNREFRQLRQDHGRLAEKFERERTRRLEYQQQQARQEREERERERERRDAEIKIDQLKRELQALRVARLTREARETERESPQPVPAVVSEGSPQTREAPPGEKPLPAAQRAREAARTPRPASPTEVAGSKPAKVSPKRERPRLGVRLPHPDDEVESGGKLAGQTRDGTQVEMFRKYYDRYLENYQGYVELAEGLYRARDNGEVSPGSFEEREWKERMRRASDGIERTATRLDLLEEHNPELATDDRISRRASVARRHAELERRSGAV